MAQENEDVEEKPVRDETRPLANPENSGGRGCVWPIVRLLPLFLMLIAMALPWTVDIRPLSGYVTIGLLGAFTIGLFCVPFLSVLVFGVALAVLPPTFMPRGRNVMSILYMVALAIAFLLCVGMVVVGGRDALDDTYGAMIYALLAIMALVLEIFARRTGRA